MIGKNQNYNFYNFGHDIRNILVNGFSLSCNAGVTKIINFIILILFIFIQLINCLTLCLLFYLLHTFSKESEDKESRRRKVCRCGAGVENTPNMCDTPGFPLRAVPTLVHDL